MSVNVYVIWIGAILCFVIVSLLIGSVVRVARNRRQEDRIFAANMRAYFRSHPE